MERHDFKLIAYLINPGDSPGLKKLRDLFLAIGENDKNLLISAFKALVEYFEKLETK